MAEGRQQGNAIRRYVEELRAANAPKRRGRARTPASLEKRLRDIKAAIDAGDMNPMTEVQLRQERLDLTAELERLTNARDADPAQFEKEFVAAVKPYSERKGITYQAWRELGIPRSVLQKAGMA